MYSVSLKVSSERRNLERNRAMQQQAGKSDSAARKEKRHAEAQAQGEREANVDSGYAWLILLVMFLIASTIGGSTRVYGLVFAREVETGYYDREQASLPIATASAVECLAGIFSPAVVQLLSWRNIELISSSLFVLANLLAYFSSSLALDILALGVTQGLALSIYSVLGLLINNDYFERYRTTAYGISLSGSTFGLLYLNPIVNWLLDNYDDFRLVYLALACLFSFNLLLVLFIRPRAEAPKLAWLSGRFQGRRDHDQGEPRAGSGVDNDTPSQDPKRKRSRLEPRFLESRNSVASISYMARSRRASAMSRTGPAESVRKSERASGNAVRSLQPGQAKKISVAGSALAANLAVGGRSSPKSLGPASRQNSIRGLDSEAGGGGGEVELDVASLCRQLERELQTDEPSNKSAQGPLDEQQQQQSFSLVNLMGLLRLPYLHCTWLMLALYNLIARIYVIILVDFARDHGVGHSDSSNLLNYWSLGELVGRLFLGSLIDMQFLSCRSCVGLTCALVAAVMVCMVLVESYLMYALSSMLVAALISLEYMLINVMMVEYIGKQMVTNCYSLAAAISSLVLFGRPAMIGFFRDRLGSYDGLLLTLAGLAAAFAALFYLLEPLFVRYWPKGARGTLKPT